MNSTQIGPTLTFGVDIDAESRCKHYHSELDRIAIKFPCCNQYYSCFECHQELAEHPPQIWNADNGEEKAILCGNCGAELSINEYKGCNSQCPHCQARFNPGCKAHWHLYFSSEPQSSSTEE